MKSKDVIRENILTILLCGFACSLFFSKTGMSVFGLASILLMLIQKYVITYDQKNFIPRTVFWLSIFFFLNLVISAALSENSRWAFSQLTKYRHVLFGGLLFAAPLSSQNRKTIITVLFVSAALDALTGILQHFDMLAIKSYSAGRPLGNSSDAVVFASNLAIIGCAGVVLFFVSTDMHIRHRFFIATVSCIIVIGIIVSRSRGIWIAFFTSCTTILLFLDKRKTALFVLCCIICSGIIFSTSSVLRERAISTITDLYVKSENVDGNSKIANDWNRFELWKGALLIFREHPTAGTGFGDFQADIKRLIAEKRLKDMEVTVHAHNIFLQVLATRGIIGFGILVSLFFAVMKWGYNEIHRNNRAGGYVILTSTLLTLTGGLTDSNIETHRLLASYCFVIGLIGPFQSEDCNSIEKT